MLGKMLTMKCILVFTLINLYLLSFSSCIPIQSEESTGYETCPKGDPQKLNVHLVCHTHNDVGWLKTVDQYYYGAKSQIQRAGVQYIIDSVIQSLLHDPNKKFVYVETAFFWRWWNEQSDYVRHQVKKLACNGQLQFAGGGWSMNDEATTHYNSIIDQMTWGLRRLNDTLGSCGLPKVAWQIDPFGHSREQASLFAQMYFDGLFFGRLDYQEKSERMKNKTMEHIWKGSNNLGLAGDLFTGALPNGYGPPSGFCFDILCNDQPIMDDPRLKDYNVEERVSTFIDAAQQQAKFYATNHLIMTMGEDFNYQNADIWFKNLDKLIRYVNEKQNNGSNVNVFYSTPACYLYALNQQNRTWTEKNDDFFPYASDPHAYWAGFYTSRPSVKRYERIGNNVLQVCKQLAAIADFEEFDINVLREAMGIMQHHDAVTGTEKQLVTYDYEQTLAAAIKSCEVVINDAYKNISSKYGKVSLDQVFCDYLNQSQCNITESKMPVGLTVYNPLAWSYSTYIRIPVVGTAFKVYGPDGGAIDAQVIEIPASVKNISGRTSNATHELVFQAELPAVGYSTYLIRNSSSGRLAAAQRSYSKKMKNTSGNWSISNEFYTVYLDEKTGLLNKVLNKAIGKNVTVTQSFYWYRAMNGDNTDFSKRASGAYIFRPNGTEPLPISSNVSVTIVNGSLVQEIHQVFNTWVSQTIRLHKGVENIEFDWVIGPIPVNDEIGKEIITRFDTDLDSSDTFFTDSNGREIQKRVRNKHLYQFVQNVTEPVAGNYYPVNSRIYIRDKSKDLQFTVLTDRSQGGSSLKNGSVELMVHRRLLHDDAFGVGEALNELGVDGKGLVIRGSHKLIISDIESSASKHRPLAQKLYLQPQLSFFTYNGSEAEVLKNITPRFSSLTRSLKPNIHLLTLEPWKRGTILLRLEDFYEFDDSFSTNLSEPTKVNLTNLFSTFDISSIEETTLSANQFISAAKTKKLQWLSKDSVRMSSPINIADQGHLKTKNDLVIDLGPMMIRTFILGVKHKK